MSLYIVATPIGNLQDITLRALDTLRAVDVIVAEDTRVTRKLLSRFEIEKRLLPLHEHSRRQDIDRVVRLLEEGKSVAYVTDAGTPSISDPGAFFVRHALELLPELLVVAIPGPSALAAVLSVSGIDGSEFLFAGFPPHKKGRKSFFERIARVDIPVVLYESPHRIVKTVEGLIEVGVGARRAVLAREMTKLHETILRGTVEELREKLRIGVVRGEFVLILDRS